MAIRIREYSRPGDWPSATEALRRPGVRTRPLVQGPRAEALADLQAEAVVDLSRLDLAYIRREGAVLRLGGLTPLQALVESQEVRSVANGILSTAAELAGGRGMRQVASVAGALWPGAGPPEVALALLALEATATLRGEDTREALLADFQPATGEVVAEVRVDVKADVYGSLQRVARTPRDQAIVAVVAALAIARGTCARARVAVAGAGPGPMRLAEVEALLEGKAYSASLLTDAERAAQAAASPTGDYRGSAEYRKSLAGTLVGRAIDEAWGEAGR